MTVFWVILIGIIMEYNCTYVGEIMIFHIIISEKFIASEVENGVKIAGRWSLIDLL